MREILFFLETWETLAFFEIAFLVSLAFLMDLTCPDSKARDSESALVSSVIPALDFKTEPASEDFKARFFS